MRNVTTALAVRLTAGRIPGLFGKIMVIMIPLALILCGLPGTVVAQGPPPPPKSLKDVAVKEPPNLYEFIKDKKAAIALGKALFWDMQVGSDGVQSCATCHFKAGADDRSKNQLNPNTNGGDAKFGNISESIPSDPDIVGLPGFAPNYQVKTTDFPFHSRLDETAPVPRPGLFPPLTGGEFDNVERDCNDVMSSQGVRFTKFLGVIPGFNIDLGWPLDDPIFDKKGINLRRVEPRNTPTVINAGFNGDNFWEGRASMVFNGVNPFGFRDQESTLKKVNGKNIEDVFVRIPYSSLASQAVGPPLSDFEMSFQGRDFPSIGRKMLTLRPLDKQLVHPQDSVLGLLSRARLDKWGNVVGDKGLKEKNYAEMIKKAFKSEWWDSPDICSVVDGTQFMHLPEKYNPRTFMANNGRAIIKKWKNGMKLGDKDYRLMEYNFSLFFGLAVQLYEATLIADDTPFDRFQGADLNVRGNGKPILADLTAMTEQEILGLDIFQGSNISGKNIFVPGPAPGTTVPFTPGCSLCHALPETTEHAVRSLGVGEDGVPRGIIFVLPEGFGGGFVPSGTYFDFGMRNLAHRPSEEDGGREATAPDLSPFRNSLNANKPFPLSYVELAKLKKASKLPPDVALYVPDLDVDVVNPIGLPLNDRVVTKGAFKVPNLRIGKWTAPYFHDGGYSTMRQVVQFYARGGNFPAINFNELALGIVPQAPLDVSSGTDLEKAAAEERIRALVAFLTDGLSDKRVEYQRAPFDHPQLFVPNGSPDRMPMFDNFIEIPAVGKDGSNQPITTFLDLDPQSP